MELAVYIKNLLYNHDLVVIPGLGTLRTRYKPAEVNASEHVITPPSKYLVFERTSDPSDNLLAGAVAEHKSVDLTKAKEFVSEQVSALKTKLSAGETIFMEGIGYFSEQNSTVRFEREPGANFLTDSFGLTQVEYKLSETETTSKHKSYSDETINQTVKKKNYTPWIVAAVLLVIAGAALTIFLFHPDIFRIKRNPQPLAVVEPELQDTTSLNNKDTLNRDSVDILFDNATDKKRALSLPEQKTTAPVHEGTVSYYIIAGSFKTYDRAGILAAQLRKEGYKPEVIKFEEELYRVSLGAFKSKDQGLAELEKIRSKKGENAVWLLTK